MAVTVVGAVTATVQAPAPLPSSLNNAITPVFDAVGKTVVHVGGNGAAFGVADEVAFERLRRRAKVEGRADDTDDAIQRRLDNYHRETEPLIEYYRTRGNLVTIHADRSENEVFMEIQRALDQVAVIR